MGLIFGRVIELLESVSPEDLANVHRPLDARLATFVFTFNANGDFRGIIDPIALRRFLDEEPGWEAHHGRSKIVLGVESRFVTGVAI